MRRNALSANRARKWDGALNDEREYFINICEAKARGGTFASFFCFQLAGFFRPGGRPAFGWKNPANSFFLFL